jgi:3-methyladenine DNA glycosylase Mpg
MTTATINYATKGDTVSASFTMETSMLMVVYTDPANRYVYAVDDKEVVRKLSITRDVEHARKQYKIARSLIGKQVRFGVTAGWSSDTWFNEIVEA